MRTLILFIKGIIVGAGNVVPSFSGATLALVMGIYNEMVQYFGQLLSFFKGNSTGKQVRSFLIPVGLGIVLGTLALAKVIEGLLSRYPVLTAMLFVGLILGILPSIFNKGNFTSPNFAKIIGLALGLALMLTLRYLQQDSATSFTSMVVMPQLEASYLLKLMFCGLLGAMAMMLPGISGTLVLVILGEYTNILAFINIFTTSLLQFVNGNGFANENLISAVIFLTIFTLAFVIGLVVSSKVIDKLLKKFTNFMYGTILGLLIGTIVYIWPALPFEMPKLLFNIMVMIVGAALAYLLSRKNLS